MLLAGSCEKEPLEQRPLKRINFKRLDSSTAQRVLLVISYVFSLLGLTAALEVENSSLQLSFCWSPTVGAAVVLGGQSSLSGVCRTDTGGGGWFLTLPSMHNWYWAWKIWYNFVIVSAAAPLHPQGHSTTIYAIDSACSTTQEEENWRGREAEGVGLSKGIYFTRFPMLFAPHSVGFCLLTCGKCQVKCLCVHAQWEGRVSWELVKIVKDKLIITKIEKQSIADCWTAYMEKKRVL